MKKIHAGHFLICTLKIVRATVARTMHGERFKDSRFCVHRSIPFSDFLVDDIYV